MNPVLEPLRATSLTEQFVERFEELILSGRLSIGQKLPSERELARQLAVSRPVVHDGLVALEARGLVTIQPRVGTVVNDYRRSGSLALLTSLMRHADAHLEPTLLEGLLSMRQLMEVETARLAARHRTGRDLRDLAAVIDAEGAADPDDLDTVVDLDFELHHRVALASANPLYSMLLKSCEPAQRNLARLFFEVPGTVPIVFGFHAELVEAIRRGDGTSAAAVMERLLQHGRDVLNNVLQATEPANLRVG